MSSEGPDLKGIPLDTPGVTELQKWKLGTLSQKERALTGHC